MLESEIDTSAAHMIRDNSKCILCRRCVAVCEKVQGIGVIGANERGFKTYIGSAFDMGLGETSCVSCGQCIAVCPTGALREKDFIDEVLDAVADPEKYVCVQTAPAVRAALGEEFGYPMGTDVEGKMAAALRRIGFDKVFDTNFSADLTIMEEAHEFLDRVQNGGVLPMITSCSPGWIKYCEHYFPDMTENLSSCKSPQQMFGAVLKTYYAEKMGIDPKKIVSVSIMPCTAKKFEIGRPDQSAAGVPDVDYAMTTRELARMIKRLGIRFNELSDEDFDDPLGESTGAAVIFGATGGVMEAALRTAVETLTGEELTNLDFVDVRGTKGIKEAAYNVAGMDVKVAVASGLGNARELLEKVKSGEADYHLLRSWAAQAAVSTAAVSLRYPELSVIRWTFRAFEQRFFMITTRQRPSVNPMKILPSRRFMRSILESREAIKPMKYFIQAMLNGASTKIKKITHNKKQEERKTLPVLEYS